jgi:DNA (cytosine-5)-methyltransferase 1
VQSHHAQTFITQPADPLVFENSYRDGIRISGTGMTQTLSAKMGTGGNNTPMVAQENEPELVVRRLTPLECERLMGWPDNHTATGTNGPVSDSNRYKMCGNGVASPVAAWIARHLPRLDA